ncbi:hypothetical protein BJX65DRAFT_270061 [Aspergillus insuetus]
MSPMRCPSFSPRVKLSASYLSTDSPDDPVQLATDPPSRKQGCPAYKMRHSMKDQARPDFIGPYRVSFRSLIWARTFSAWFGVSASRYREPWCYASARLKPGFEVSFPSYTHSLAPHFY